MQERSGPDRSAENAKQQKEISVFQQLRKTGLDFICEAAWGSHLTVFYKKKSDLIDVLPNFFRFGLQNNEYCLWVTASLSVSEAKAAMRETMPDIDNYLLKGQMEIVPHTEVYFNADKQFEPLDVINRWIDKLNQALNKSYDGMRFSGDTLWLEKKDWQNFDDYEQVVSEIMKSNRMIGLCTFPLDKCGTSELINICRKHQFAFIKQEDEQDLLFNQDTLTRPNDKSSELVVVEGKMLKQMKEDLLRFDRLNLVGELAASVGHEIRNSLTAVRGFLQLLKTKNDNSDLNDSYNLMIEELDRANSMLSEYLDLAKNKTVSYKSQSINQVIQSLYPLIEADAIMSGKEVVLELEEVPDLLINEKEIRQLILNLSRNGLEAMKEGGVLTIRTFRDGNDVVLSVQDQGSGIAPDELEKVFNPFYTSKENGTGMGLPICHKIVNRHKAKLITQTNHKGSTFLVCFKISGSKALKIPHLDRFPITRGQKNLV